MMRKQATHSTLGAQKNAVNAEDYWDFQPGQRVMTIDGIHGVVAAVDDGPFPGLEEYQVTLDSGMGGGAYTASQLQASTQTTATGNHTAAEDYPELAQVLQDRPDPGQIHTVATNGRDDTDGDPWGWAGDKEEFFTGNAWDAGSNLPGPGVAIEPREDESKIAVDPLYRG